MGPWLSRSSRDIGHYIATDRVESRRIQSSLCTLFKIVHGLYYCPPNFVTLRQNRYLGLLLTPSLCWSEHINDICAKAKRMVGLLYRRFYKDASPQTLFQMYLALVRPHNEYASQVWDPHLQKDIDQLECVQKFALRMCAKQWDLGYAELLNCFKVPSVIVEIT